MRPRPLRARRDAFGARAGFATGFDGRGFGFVTRFGAGVGFVARFGTGFDFDDGFAADRDFDLGAGFGVRFDARFDFRAGADAGFDSDVGADFRAARTRRTGPPSNASVDRPQRSSSPRASSR